MVFATGNSSETNLDQQKQQPAPGSQVQQAACCLQKSNNNKQPLSATNSFISYCSTAIGSNEPKEVIQIKPTLKRYVILILFAINSANKAFQWIQIPASTKKVTYFYDVENFVINATSVLFMLSFVLLSFPACYLIEHLGVRVSVLLGSFGTALGALIKCFGCHEDGIYMLFLGQTIVSLSEQMIFSVPSRLASVWFPNHQVSSAVASCVLGNQLGVALGFLVPQFVLAEAETKEEIGAGLKLIFSWTAAISLVALMLDYFLFDEEPRHAPGAARLKQMEQEREVQENRKQKLSLAPASSSCSCGPSRSFASEMGRLAAKASSLLANRSFRLLCLSYGINVGLGYTIATLLNQVLEPIWPDDDTVVGNAGSIIIVSGALGSLLWGRILDKVHRYKFLNIFLTVATILSLILFCSTLSLMHPWAVYAASALLGLFQTGLLVAGLELAVELTYPAPELLTSSLMNIMPQICGSIFVFVASYLVDNYGEIVTHLFYVALVLLALVMLASIEETLKRQTEAKKEKIAEIGSKIIITIERDETSTC